MWLQTKRWFEGRARAVASARLAAAYPIDRGVILAVLAAADCDMGLVAYEMALLVERVGRALTPDVRGVLRSEGSR